MSSLISYRILLTYNIHPMRHESYYRYMIGEFVPTLQKLDLKMLFAWHIHSNENDIPHRQVEFVCNTVDTLRTALNDPTFHRAEERLQSYTTSYKRKIVHFKNRFQF